MHQLEDNTVFDEKIFLTRYADVFDENIGAVKNYTVSLILKENARPIFQRARPVPLAIKNDVENEIQRLVELGI